MAVTSVSVAKISKRYRLGAIGTSTLYGDLNRWWARVRGRPDPTSKIHQDPGRRRIGGDFWALRNVTFDVREGEVLGVVGRNGAGKSTLLKILSKVTAPTSGEIRIKGRVASLLEVGTGFHPDLTGRENVFLNGAIMGMTRAEVRRKFDEIVAFSECEEFIDTPVKRYSSGMYVRLAFAVAAHLEPEILIVDEVLAVGDAAFQKKCLGKMNDVSRGGRTVLFVSHNMAAVKRLCTRAVLLSDGEIAVVGTPDEVVDNYLGGFGSFDSYWKRQVPLPDRSGVYVKQIWLTDRGGRQTNSFDISEPVGINVVVSVPVETNPSSVAVCLINRDGVPVLTTANTDIEDALLPLARGEHHFRVEVPARLLPAGLYAVSVFTHIPHVIRFDQVDEITFIVEDSQTNMRDLRSGVVNPCLPWSHGSPDAVPRPLVGQVV